MHSRSNDGVLFPFVHGHTELAWVVIELREFDQIILREVALDARCDRQKRHLHAAERLAEYAFLVVIAPLIFYLNLFEKVVQLCKGVRVAIRKEYFLSLAVFGRVKLECECQLEEISAFAWIR